MREAAHSKRLAPAGSAPASERSGGAASPAKRLSSFQYVPTATGNDACIITKIKFNLKEKRHASWLARRNRNPASILSGESKFGNTIQFFLMGIPKTPGN